MRAACGPRSLRLGIGERLSRVRRASPRLIRTLTQRKVQGQRSVNDVTKRVFPASSGALSRIVQKHVVAPRRLQLSSTWCRRLIHHSYGHMDTGRRDRRNTDGVPMRWTLLFMIGRTSLSFAYLDPPSPRNMPISMAYTTFASFVSAC